MSEEAKPAAGPAYTPRKERNWDSIRDDYIGSEIDLRSLAVKHSVPYPTLRDRSIRESWHNAKKAARSLSKEAVASAVSNTISPLAKEAVARRHATLALASVSADALIRRTLHESDQWLDRISRVGNQGEHENPDAIRKLTSSWRDVIQVARLTHGLDSTSTTVNVAVFGRPAAVESQPMTVANSVAIDVSSAQAVDAQDADDQTRQISDSTEKN